jgi:hypothetical protein
MKTLLPTYLRLGPRPRLSCARHFVASGLDRRQGLTEAMRVEVGQAGRREGILENLSDWAGAEEA